MTNQMFVVSVLATWEIVEVWHHSSLFKSWRVMLEKEKKDWFARMALCPFCFSVWVGFAVTWLTVFVLSACERQIYAKDFESITPITRIAVSGVYEIGMLFIYGLALARAANALNDLTRSFNRTPKDHDEDLEISPDFIYVSEGLQPTDDLNSGI